MQSVVSTHRPRRGKRHLTHDVHASLSLYLRHRPYFLHFLCSLTHVRRIHDPQIATLESMPAGINGASCLVVSSDSDSPSLPPSSAPITFSTQIFNHACESYPPRLCAYLCYDCIQEAHISSLCQGTSRSIGLPGFGVIPDLDSAQKVIDLFAGHGYTRYDTARRYSGGTAEEVYLAIFPETHSSLHAR